MRSASTIVFACYSASCRPPTSGGTGGSSGKGGMTTRTKGAGSAMATIGRNSGGGAALPAAIGGNRKSKKLANGFTEHTERGVAQPRYTLPSKNGKDFEVVGNVRTGAWEGRIRKSGETGVSTASPYLTKAKALAWLKKQHASA